MILLGNGAPRAQAQASTTSNPDEIVIPFIRFEKTDIRAALSWLFQKAGVNYRFAPNVAGLISLDTRDIPFEVALQQITRQVDVTYRIEGGTYEVVVREGFAGKSYPELRDRKPIEAAYRQLNQTLLGKDPQGIRRIVDPRFRWIPVSGKPLAGTKAVQKLFEFARQVHDHKLGGSEILRATGKFATEVRIYGETGNTSLIESGLFCDTWIRNKGGHWRLRERLDFYPSL